MITDPNKVSRRKTDKVTRKRFWFLNWLLGIPNNPKETKIPDITDIPEEQEKPEPSKCLSWASSDACNSHLAAATTQIAEINQGANGCRVTWPTLSQNLGIFLLVNGFVLKERKHWMKLLEKSRLIQVKNFKKITFNVFSHAVPSGM